MDPATYFNSLTDTMELLLKALRATQGAFVLASKMKTSVQLIHLAGKMRGKPIPKISTSLLKHMLFVHSRYGQYVMEDNEYYYDGDDTDDMSHMLSCLSVNHDNLVIKVWVPSAPDTPRRGYPLIRLNDIVNDNVFTDAFVDQVNTFIYKDKPLNVVETEKVAVRQRPVLNSKFRRVYEIHVNQSLLVENNSYDLTPLVIGKLLCYELLYLKKYPAILPYMKEGSIIRYHHDRTIIEFTKSGNELIFVSNRSETSEIKESTPLTKEDFIDIARKFGDEATITRIENDPTYQPWICTTNLVT
jgi:hypothetical protein